MKKAIIFGITGQDGSHLADLLLEKDYEVHGVVRRSSNFNTQRIEHIYPRLTLHYGDMTDGNGLSAILKKVRPNEVYNLAAQSHVAVSFQTPVYSVDVGGLGTLRLLEAVRELDGNVRYYQASSSEMFGSSPPPQNEQTPFHPRSPYACAKVYSYYQTINYREAYGLFACNGILFNHEGPRRGETFVTRKITRAATRIKLGLQERLALGNLEAKRDWGSAKDYVEAMWLMLQQDKPDDFVVATGEMHTIKEMLEEAFNSLNLKWEDYVVIDERYKRPAEVNELCGDAGKAHRILGWKPKIGFKELIRQMVEHDLKLAEGERLLKGV